MGEPTKDEITRAAWAWRNQRGRETDSHDQRYFENYWSSLPGLRRYVEAEIAKRPTPAQGEEG